MSPNNSTLHARPGDRLVVHGHRQGESVRDAEILKVLGQGGAPPYLVRWQNGHEAEIFPGSDVFIDHLVKPEGSERGAEMPAPDVIGRSVEKTNLWLNELCDELGTRDQRTGYRVLRAYLHAVRDRLTVNEAAQLAAQLPELIRGIYYEDWVPARTPLRYRSVDQFFDRVAKESKLDGETRISYACSAVARVLRRHISEGEMDDVEALFPEALRPVLSA